MHSAGMEFLTPCSLAWQTSWMTCRKVSKLTTPLSPRASNILKVSRKEVNSWRGKILQKNME